jgi:hypothetical protein
VAATSPARRDSVTTELVCIFIVVKVVITRSFGYCH